MPFEIVYERPATTRDLTGEVFGLWTIKGFDHRKLYPCGSAHNFWKCECSCPKKTQRVVSGSVLTRGQSKCCGCESNIVAAAKRIKHGYGKRGCRTLIYGSWLNMRDRCRNPNNLHYKHYGGRGIIVDPLWDNFANFLAEMGPTWNGGKDANGERLTIDRINPDSNYGPGLCRWATDEMQCNNKRASVYLVWNDQKMTVGQWSKIVGIHRSVIGRRLAIGWSIKEALTTPVRKIRKWVTDAEAEQKTK